MNNFLLSEFSLSGVLSEGNLSHQRKFFNASPSSDQHQKQPNTMQDDNNKMFRPEILYNTQRKGGTETVPLRHYFRKCFFLQKYGQNLEECPVYQLARIF